MKDLNYYKENCEEDYMHTPISVLRYITELESNKETIKLLEEMKPSDVDLSEFDHSKKHDTTYCIEFGMEKQKRMEKLIYEKQIKKLQSETKDQ